MSASRQLPLDLGHRPAFGREDFLVAGSNAAAVAWIDRWPDWPATALVVHGPPGSGKTHLATVWRARSGAAPLPGRGAADTGSDSRRAWILDGADEPADDAALLHTHDRLAGAGGHLLVTARAPPARWRGRLPDLTSRLAASPTVAIGPPDEPLLAAVLVKLFADRQLPVGAGSLSYLTARMERSFDAARRIVAAADAAALADRRAVSAPLLRQVLAKVGARGVGSVDET